MTDSNSTSAQKITTLLPSDFSNEIFEQNMAYLRDHQPALFKVVKKHKCKEYCLCSNQDGSPNIVHLPSKTPVYAASSMDEIMAPIHKQIDELFCYSNLNKTMFGAGDSFWTLNNPIQIKMLDGLYKAGIFSDMQLQGDMKSPLHNYCTDYLPLVRVYGIGLGYHLTELIKRKKISYMTIYEPNFDLFYTSLYTVPWDLIFQYFEFNNKGINLALDCTPEVALESNMAFIQKRLLPLTSLLYRFNHFNKLPILQEVIEKEPRLDNTQRANIDGGWYEDQRMGFYFSAKNIQKDNRVFSGKKIKRYCRAFIVGSGPSLNESISYIREHQDDAIIISCGTALTPLIAAGIVPDYEVVQERNWHLLRCEERHDPNILKEISLVKLNVVTTKIDKFYKDVLVLQKFRDPGSVLLGNYPVITEVNPTVTNAGIAFAAEIGVNKAYLFGVDYGAPKGSKQMHAHHTIYDDEDMDESIELADHNVELPGNLGGVSFSTSILFWSLGVTELRLAKHPDIKWVNVGEGVRIAGTIPMAIENLPGHFKKKSKKDLLLNDISNCFNNDYSSPQVLTHLNTHHMLQVKEYFQAILDFTASTPQSREEIVSTLSFMYKAASIGADQEDFLPASLLSNGIKQFINIVYTQTALYADEDSAVRFFEAAKVIFTGHIDDIKNDLHKILGYLERDEDPELYHKDSFYWG